MIGGCIEASLFVFLMRVNIQNVPHHSAPLHLDSYCTDLIRCVNAVNKFFFVNEETITKRCQHDSRLKYEWQPVQKPIKVFQIRNRTFHWSHNKVHCGKQPVISGVASCLHNSITQKQVTSIYRRLVSGSCFVRR